MKDWVRKSTPAVVLTAVVIVLVILGAGFVEIWRIKGIAEAQAYSSFLSYVATAMTVLITLVYVYLTRESLKVAQAANELQREQWSQRVVVKPKFWLETTVNAALEFPRIDSEARWKPLRYKAIEMTIWNSSEQSFLVHSAQFDIYTNVGRRTRVFNVSEVIKPHETLRKNVSYELLDLFSNGELSEPSGLGENLPKERFTLDWCICYTDWQSIHKESDRLFDQVTVIYKIQGTSGYNCYPELNIQIESDVRVCQ